MFMTLSIIFTFSGIFIILGAVVGTRLRHLKDRNDYLKERLECLYRDKYRLAKEVNTLKKAASALAARNDHLEDVISEKEENIEAAKKRIACATLRLAARNNYLKGVNEKDIKTITEALEKINDPSDEDLSC